MVLGRRRGCSQYLILRRNAEANPLERLFQFPAHTTGVLLMVSVVGAMRNQQTHARHVCPRNGWGVGPRVELRAADHEQPRYISSLSHARRPRVCLVKSDRAGFKDARELHVVLNRGQAAMAVVVSPQRPTPDMLAEAVSAGFYGHEAICGMGEGWSRLAATMQLKDAPLNRRDAIDAEAKPPPNRAKRLECVELAPAFGRVAPFESASKLGALQTLRAAVHPANQSGRRLKPRQRHG